MEFPYKHFLADIFWVQLTLKWCNRLHLMTLTHQNLPGAIQITILIWPLSALWKSRGGSSVDWNQYENDRKTSLFLVFLRVFRYRSVPFDPLYNSWSQLVMWDVHSLRPRVGGAQILRVGGAQNPRPSWGSKISGVPTPWGRADRFCLKSSFLSNIRSQIWVGLFFSSIPPRAESGSSWQTRLKSIKSGPQPKISTLNYKYFRVGWGSKKSPTLDFD